MFLWHILYARLRTQSQSENMAMFKAKIQLRDIDLQRSTFRVLHYLDEADLRTKIEFLLQDFRGFAYATVTERYEVS